MFSDACRFADGRVKCISVLHELPRSIDSSCQTGNMAALLNSLFYFSCLKSRFYFSIVSYIMIIL